MTLTENILQGDRLSLARALTLIEDDTEAGHRTLDELFQHTGQAHLVGVTGPPGSGKSSLVNQLARYYRKPLQGHPKSVGIVAVDPSSPFTGGAILGDRVRMRDLAGDTGVFIRSMASRGSLGGLAAATSGVVQAMDAAGYELIFIETVGAGQAEVEIVHLAHTTLVVEAPGMGDDIQAIKAGILEIADILVVNKADHPGVEATVQALRGMLQLAHPAQRVFSDFEPINVARRQTGSLGRHDQYRDMDQNMEFSEIWIPPILQTIATEGTGVVDLAREVDRHFQHLKDSGELLQRDRSRLVSQLDALLREKLLHRWRARITDVYFEQTVERLMQREISPWQAVDQLTD